MKIRTLTATLATGALLAGATAAPAMAQTATYPSDSGTTTKKKGKKAKKGKVLTQAQLTTIAGELDVTVDQLTAAIKKVKTTIAATDERETKAEVDALLATELGVTVEQLQAAFTAAGATGPVRTAPTSDSGYPSDSGANYPGDRGGRGDCGGRGEGGSGNYPSDGGSGNYPSDNT